MKPDFAAAQYEQLPRKGFLGVRLALLSDEVRARLQLQSGSGVLIEAVIVETPSPVQPSAGAGRARWTHCLLQPAIENSRREWAGYCERIMQELFGDRREAI